jgi:Fic family protein
MSLKKGECMPKWAVNFNARVDVRNQEVVYCVARIHALASVIHNIPIPPGMQARIDALNIMRAIRGTTGIEGSDLSEEEVRLIMEAPSDEPVLSRNKSREEQEVRNAEQVMYFVAKQLSENPSTPITEELICNIHEITTRNIAYVNNTPGRYRSHPVNAGTYLPPETGEEVRVLMMNFMHWLNEGIPSNWDPVVKAVLAHFYVVSIHPFGDGNGRTARGVESFLLYQAGVNARGFYSLANFYYRRRDEYIRLLDYVRFETNGDLTPFILFSLRGLMEELEAVHFEILEQVKVIAFRDFARETLLTHGKLGNKSGERMFHFLLELAARPVSLGNLRNGEDELAYLYKSVTTKTLSRDISFLKQHELVIQDGDKLSANLDIMTIFTPPSQMRRPRMG